MGLIYSWHDFYQESLLYVQVAKFIFVLSEEKCIAAP